MSNTHGHLPKAERAQLPAELQLRLAAWTTLSVGSGWQRFIEAFGIRPDSWTETVPLPWHEGAL
jgi:hypothetical protein